MTPNLIVRQQVKITQKQIEVFIRSFGMVPRFFPGDKECIVDGFSTILDQTIYISINKNLSVEEQLLVSCRELAHVGFEHIYHNGDNTMNLSQEKRRKAEVEGVLIYTDTILYENGHYRWPS